MVLSFSVFSFLAKFVKNLFYALFRCSAIIARKFNNEALRKSFSLHHFDCVFLKLGQSGYSYWNSVSHSISHS